MIENRTKRVVNTNIVLWTIVSCAALQVKFIVNGRELFLYTNALYEAMMWGWGESIEERNRKSSTEDKLMVL